MRKESGLSIRFSIFYFNKYLSISSCNAKRKIIKYLAQETLFPPPKFLKSLQHFLTTVEKNIPRNKSRDEKKFAPNGIKGRKRRSWGIFCTHFGVARVGTGILLQCAGLSSESNKSSLREPKRWISPKDPFASGAISFARFVVP
jgi:hypothetical protein